jgi:hypothetical protein
VGIGLGGRGDEPDVATLVWRGTRFVGPKEGSEGSFGRCGVSSSVRIMLFGQLDSWGRKEWGETDGIIYTNGNYVVRSSWR